MSEMAGERDRLSRACVKAMRAKGLTFKQLASQIGVSPFITAAALLGQMALPEAVASKAAKALGLAEAEAFLSEIPYRGSLGMAVPTDPTIYRFYEIVQVYGATLKELIHEEFGDGIMSAIDFDLELSRQPDPNGDRVRIVMTGKFLKYKKT